MNLTSRVPAPTSAAVRSRYRAGWRRHLQNFRPEDFHHLGQSTTTDIVHLVLARTPNAPEGQGHFALRGAEVPAQGRRHAGRAQRCLLRIDRAPLGIHGSPTAVLAFGDNSGHRHLVGEENRGLEYMFIMMNAARFNVGLEGLGDAERAYQRAVALYRGSCSGGGTGRQGRAEGADHQSIPDVTSHADVDASRASKPCALAYVTAAAQDNAHCNPDESARQQGQAFADLMIPWSRAGVPSAIDIASLGVQVHGGMGFIETGAAQHLRDARITAIYEERRRSRPTT